MLSTIFLIETNRFLSRAIELALKEQGVSCYSTELILDCFYLIRDLKPQVITISAEALIPVQDIFFNQFINDKECRDIPLILLGDERSILEIKNSKAFLGHISKPIAPFEFKTKLELILRST